MQFLIVECSKSQERSGMMPIIMDDQILEIKKKEFSLHLSTKIKFIS